MGSERQDSGAESAPVTSTVVARTRTRDTGRRSRVTVLSVIGELMITAAVLMGLHFAWEVLYTDFVAERERAGIAAAWLDTQDEPAERVGSKHHEKFPVVSGEGVIGLLHVPRWGDSYTVPIATGIEQETLDTGMIGHYSVTQHIGEVGNAGLAGHRTTHGKPLRQVHHLEESDELVVETREAWLVYGVVGRDIVRPDQSEVLDPVPPIAGATKGRYLTLTTCDPIFGNTDRYIIWSEAQYWTPKSEGLPPALGTAMATGSEKGPRE